MMSFAANLAKPANSVRSFARKDETKVFEKPAQGTCRPFLLRKKYYIHVSMYLRKMKFECFNCFKAKGV